MGEKRNGLVFLGIALGVLWLAGLRSGSTGWLVWLDFAVALLSFLFGIMPGMVPSVLRAAPFAFGGGLIGLWIVGLATRGDVRYAWWTFAFGVAYLLLGLVGTEGRLRRPDIRRSA